MERCLRTWTHGQENKATRASLLQIHIDILQAPQPEWYFIKITFQPLSTLPIYFRRDGWDFAGCEGRGRPVRAVQEDNKRDSSGQKHKHCHTVKHMNPYSHFPPPSIAQTTSNQVCSWTEWLLQGKEPNKAILTASCSLDLIVIRSTKEHYMSQQRSFYSEDCFLWLCIMGFTWSFQSWSATEC